MKNCLILLFVTFNLFAKITPPNYDFSLDTLEVFMPGAAVVEMEKKYGKGELQRKEDDIILLKFYVAHLRYKFPVFVQIYNGKSLSFFARLPTYFLHDLFHQSLINRLGPQDNYIKKGEHAIYIWSQKGNMLHTYCGSCTITCFPQYYTVSTKNKDKKFVPLIDEFVKKQ